MITEKITSEQEKQLKRLFEDALSALGLSKDQAQEIIKNGGKMQAGVKDVLSKLSVADKRFELLNAFELIVPPDYKHADRLDSFKKKHKKEFYGYNDAITDKNFSKATTKLVPGRKFKVKIFQITEKVTSENCMDFLKTQNAVLVGAQGASLLYELKKEQLPLGKWSVSFDEKDSLWTDSDGDHGVPGVNRDSDGDWSFHLGDFGGDWGSDVCLVCFCD